MDAHKGWGKTVIPPSVYPERHELETASFFTSKGKDVEFLLPSRSKGVRTPDILMDGVAWEIKSPTGASSSTIEHAF